MTNPDTIGQSTERARLVEEIWAKITREERTCQGGFNLYRILIFLLGKRLGVLRGEISTAEFPKIPTYITEQAFKFFENEVLQCAEDYERSGGNRHDLYRELLERAIGEIDRLD